MKLKSVKFVLKNCDSITIDSKYIRSITLENIKDCISGGRGYVMESKVIGSFKIQIARCANKKKCINDNPGMKDLTYDIFNRLCDIKDINRIILNVEEENENDSRETKINTHEYFADWPDFEMYLENNPYENTMVDEDGELYITIGKDIRMEDFYVDEENDKTWDEFSKYITTDNEENDITEQYEDKKLERAKESFGSLVKILKDCGRKIVVLQKGR